MYEWMKQQNMQFKDVCRFFSADWMLWNDMLQQPWVWPKRSLTIWLCESLAMDSVSLALQKQPPEMFSKKKASLKISEISQVFSCEIWEIFINNYFEEHLRTTASGTLRGVFRRGVFMKMVNCRMVVRNLHHRCLMGSKYASGSDQLVFFVWHVETLLLSFSLREVEIFFSCLYITCNKSAEFN